MNIKYLFMGSRLDSTYNVGRTLLCIVAVLFSGLLMPSCQENVPKQVRKETDLDTELKMALVKGYYDQVNEDISIAVYKNDLYYFSVNSNGFSPHKFMLHLIKKDFSFDNKDFFKDDAIVDTSLTRLFGKNIQVLHRIIEPKDFEALRTGQFIRAEKGNENLWTRQVKFEDIRKRKNTYKNELTNKIGVNLLNDYFEKGLNQGVFFQIRKGFYILLFDDVLYLITENKTNLSDKIMLHFIREDGTFENISFVFREKEYQQYLESPYNTFKIARVNSPVDKRSFSKIRIGQYNFQGNLWVQIISIKDVYSNELLRYENEFGKTTTTR